MRVGIIRNIHHSFERHYVTDKERTMGQENKNTTSMVVPILSDLHLDVHFRLFNQTKEEAQIKIDILSDHHINAHIKHLKPDDRLVEKLWNRLEPQGEVLLVAGDIGEINEQNVNFLASLKRLFYKEIVCVLGNHDLHTQ